jgi:hypothetical protein
MSIENPFAYGRGTSLGSDDDGEIRAYSDDEGNLYLLAWRFEKESGEPIRAEDYDGSLCKEQVDALRVLLTEHIQ